VSLQLSAEPAAAGLDAGRLRRLDDRLDRWLAGGSIPGYLLTVSRHGELVHVASAGYRDVESGAPVRDDTIWRLFSMTKPITSVAALSLWEDGAFDLDDPISTWLPEFADLRVYAGGPATAMTTVPARTPITVRHLLTHTSGLSHGHPHVHPVDEAWRAAGFLVGGPDGTDLRAAARIAAGLPLLFEPGTAWHYGFSVDVLGALLEVIGGMPLDELIAEQVLDPLGMTDTSFGLRPGTDPERLATLYDTTLQPLIQAGAKALHRQRFLAAGGGLVGTAADYLAFADSLRPGAPGVLGPRTLAFATRNHLPGGVDLKAAAVNSAHAARSGVGFGLGLAVVQDPVAWGVPANVGDLSWGGAAGTEFWVDPVDDVVVTVFSQVLGCRFPLARALRQLLAQAVIR
jgi:CubicO group peptidase (beta-lactamase class C family)